jgi:protocatechuate 3,4-dioxygenase beta subunit
MITTALLLVAVPLLLLGVANGSGTCDAGSLALTTTDQLGPFYMENSVMGSVIASRELLIDPTNVFVVNGAVLGNDCVPLVGARVEAWYAGDQSPLGEFYSMNNHRGQVVTDLCGKYRFTQTFPALYPERPIPHIHYRISAPDGTELLVTQLYFEGLIPSGFNPDNTKITTVVNQPDSSRSAEFHIYVDIPGNADLAACDEATVGGGT